MNNQIVKKIEQMCDESREATGEPTFWFTKENISDEDILQVYTDFNQNQEYGFMIKHYVGAYYIDFYVHKFEKRFFGLLHPYVRKSKCVASLSIDLNNLTENDIQGWFTYVNHKFKKKYRPKLIEGT